MIVQVRPISSEPLFVFAGGGTGGHLYPAIAVARELRELIGEARFLFLGTERPIDRRITDTIDCEFVSQALRGVSLVPWRMMGAYLDFRKASSNCWSRFNSDRPVVVVGTGGMASVPAVREAFRAGVPTALFNPDAIPGKANRHLATRANVVFSQFEQTIGHFPHGVEVKMTGCPVRPEFVRSTREEGIISFGLDPALKTLLITGASLGARTVNQAVVANAEFLDSWGEWQVLHLTGQNDFEMVSTAYRNAGCRRVRVMAYTEEMSKAMAASDLIVSRAGASTLAEILAAGRASILMPYPFHRDQHQVANARCLADVGAAELILDRIDPSTNAGALRAALLQGMQDEGRRSFMAQQVRRLGVARANAAGEIARILLQLAGLVPASPCVSGSLKASTEPAR